MKETIERQDMLKRRCESPYNSLNDILKSKIYMLSGQVEIPEFYVGSILAVSTSDQHSPNKKNRFVGICILREFCGLNARFILRNVVDHQGIEVIYDLYDPTILKVEILRLEKRLDDRLLYLRDALPEYSTFDFNMEPEVLPDNTPVPVNDIKVKLKPRPWSEKWERQDVQGVENIDELLYDKYKMLAKKLATPWEKYDLMKEYRRTIPEEEQNVIFSEVVHKLQELEVSRKKGKKRTFLKPKKLA